MGAMEELITSQLKRTGVVLRSVAEDQVREYDQRFSSTGRFAESLIRDLIVQGIDYGRSFTHALNLFEDDTVRFAAIDGTGYSQALFDLIIFFGGAYAIKGDLTLYEDKPPSIAYDQHLLSEGQGVSSCVPMYINEAVELDQTILEIDDHDRLEIAKPLTDDFIIKNVSIADHIMTFSEFYLAYRIASDPKDPVKLILLDRSLYTTHSSLLYDTSHRRLWRTCSLHGLTIEGYKLDMNDLGYGRHRIVNEALKLPPWRGEYLRYGIIYLLEKTPMRREQLYDYAGARSAEQKERVDRFVEKSIEEGYLIEEGPTLRTNPRYAETWPMLKKAVLQIGDQLYRGYKGNPMKIDKGEKTAWLTTLDFKFLTLFTFNMLIEECWRGSILLLGVTKDTSARDLKNHAIPVLQNEGIWNLGITQEGLEQIPNTDRMLLQFISLRNFEKLKPPWSFVEYDSAFTTIIPEYEKRRKGYISGSIKNEISLERVFLKSYIQLSQARSDPQLRSNVLLIDRLAHPKYDWGRCMAHLFKHEYGGAEEGVEPIIYSSNKVENPMQNLAMTILHAMSDSSIPEAFGHNVPLFMADKVAKHGYSEFKRIIDTTKYWITNNPNLRRFIFYMSTFRERRGEIESGRRFSE